MLLLRELPLFLVCCREVSAVRTFCYVQPIKFVRLIRKSGTKKPKNLQSSPFTFRGNTSTAAIEFFPSLQKTNIGLPGDLATKLPLLSEQEASSECNKNIVNHNVSVVTFHRLSLSENTRMLAALAKCRLTGLVVSTALAGCALAAPTPFVCDAFLAHPATAMFSLAVGTALTSASANTVNQIIEVPYDRLMRRTQMRPLVRKLTTPENAAVFAIICGVSGLTLLSLTTNLLVAGLAACNFILYTSIYTPLKRVSQANTWVGSLVGGIPPLMGWAAATGGLEWGSLILAALLYCWQLPHFMALSWNIRHDYARAGFVMTANVDPPLCKRTALRHSVLSSLVCLAGAGCNAASLGPWAGWSLGLGCLPVNCALVYYAWKFYRASPESSAAAARRLFRASLLHLPVVMTVMLFCTHWSAASWT